MTPTEQELREAVEVIKKQMGDRLPNYYSVELAEAIKILLSLAHSHLSALQELPERKDVCESCSEDCERDKTEKEGKYIVWDDHGYEGFSPNYYDTLEEAVKHESYGSPKIITKVVNYKVEEVSL